MTINPTQSSQATGPGQTSSATPPSPSATICRYFAEQGTHAELLQLGGHYAKLWSHQSGGFLPMDGDPVPVDVESEVQAALSSAAREEPASTKA